MYYSRHSKRDQNLPQERNELLLSIVNNLKSTPNVLAAFLGGSIAHGDEDNYSDIDLRLVVSETDYGSFIDSKQEIPSEWGSVLFFEDMNPSAPFTIAHYDNFIKVDVFFYTLEKLQPSIWLKDIKVLFDPDDVLSHILEQSKAMTFHVTAQEVESWRGKVFSYIHEVYRRVQREEFYYALHMMNNLRAFIVHAWNMEVDRHSNAAWDWSKVEGERSKLEAWQLCLLDSWSCGRDKHDIMKTLMSMLPEITRLQKVLCKKTGVEEKKDRLNKVIDLVV